MFGVSFISSSRPLRTHLLNGEFFVGSAVGSTLTKLALRFIELEPDVVKQNVSITDCACYI